MVNFIGKAIKHYRKIVGITQAQLAEKAGLNAGVISHYESGRREVSREALEKISEALSVNIDKFYAYVPLDEINAYKRKTSIYDIMPNLKSLDLLQALGNNYIKRAAFSSDRIDLADTPGGSYAQEYFILFEEQAGVTIKFKPSDVADLEEKLNAVFDNWMTERELLQQREQFKYIMSMYANDTFKAASKGDAILGEIDNKYIVGSDEWLDIELARDAEYKKLERLDDE